MATATKKKPAPVQQPEAPKTAKQQVADALETYFSLENAVHATYLLDGEIEITTARKNLFEVLAGIEEPETDEPEFTLEDAWACIGGNFKGVQLSDLEDAIGESRLLKIVKDYATCNNYCFVKTESLLQRNKLEEFLRTEIWTTYGLYNQNVIL